MLVALNAAGQVVNLLEQAGSRSEPYTCPACFKPVHLRQGQVMRPYFAHVSLRDCHFFHENESREHLELKAMLFRSLSAAGHQVQVEAVLPELGQVADVLVNDKLVLEVQCSRLSLARLSERTQAYHEAGYRVIWLLGKKLWLGKVASPLHRGLLYFSKNMGFHLWELDVEQQQLRLRYLLHETLSGHLVGLEQTSPLCGNILHFLRQPFVSQPLAQLEVEQDKEPLIYIQRQLIQKNTKWLARQEQAYLQGDNLLSWSKEDFYPQVRPLQGDFLQIQEDLQAYWQDFLDFYRRQTDKNKQVLYSPRFYTLVKSQD